MWRAMFLAIGFFVMIVGAECLGVESVRLKIHEDPPAPVSLFDSEAQEGPLMQITPRALGTLEPALSGRGGVPVFVYDSAASGGQLTL